MYVAIGRFDSFSADKCRIRMFSILSGVGRRSMTTDASAALKTLSRLKIPPTGHKSLKLVGVAAGVLCGGFVLKNSVLLTDAGYIYVVQNNLSGTMDVHTEPGIHRRMPFFSTVTPYKKVLTISQDSRVRFADTYTGTMPASFRFKLPITSSSVLKFHTEFRSEQNLAEVLV